MTLFELKITEPKEGRYHVLCYDDYETTMYDSIEEAIDRAQKYLDKFRSIATKKEAI